ncbi:hypothetical protein EB796_009578 [Bugula neritina]|uniref:RZ-type domain-containing protein n=1 Tax=Bugula neritina TaxID=10212 RepID=A0A7J7K3B0_BUGNE|nr:hypothetical protein EB796_009578 [Bugula neritina]
MLILHLYACMYSTTHVADLYPLFEIIESPSNCTDRFFPTMADNQFEVHQEAIRKALQKEGENPVAYRCPNGHPYVIGDCGRPYYLATCHECGAQIGGQGHKAATGNAALATGDSSTQSRKGHILGRQTSRPGVAPERELSSLSCAVLRCLTHLAMYTSSLFSRYHMFRIIQPNLVREDDVRPFIDAHIQLDLQQIAQCCAESTDDCILLLHDVINRMKQASHIGENITLDTTDIRKKWEREFDERYIQPVFDNRKHNLETIKGELDTSKSVDIKDILSTVRQPLNRANLLASPGLWAYRRPLTVPALQNLLVSTYKEAPRLCDVINSSEKLMALKYLPDILNLMRLLNGEFHSKFSRAKADSLTIRDFCDQYATEANGIRRLTNSYISSWNLMLQSSNKSMTVTLILMNIDSPLSQLLYDRHAPKSTTKSQISTPFQLVNFLVDIQNKLLAYDDNRQSIKLSSANSSHVISIENCDELLDLVLAHGEYELRETTSVTYNWPAIEREVIHRYISNKPRIEFSRDQLPFYVYQEDFNLHNQMQTINESQERLDKHFQESIINALTQRIPVLTAHLKDLQVIINILSVAPHIEGEDSLAEYMKETFGREPEYLSQEIRIKHVKHVWLLLKYAQTDLLMKQHQEPFDDLPAEYRDNINQDLLIDLSDHFRYNSPKTKKFLLQLFDFIIIGLNKAAVVQDSADPENSIVEALKTHIMKSFDEIQAYELMEELPPLPTQLKARHASKAWCYIWTQYTTRRE